MQSVNEENLLASDRANNHKSSKKGSKCRNMTKPPESQPIVEQPAEPLPETIPINGVDFDEDEDHSELESFNITDNDNEDEDEDEEEDEDDEEEDEDEEGGYGDVDDEEIDETDDDKSFNGSAEQDEEEIDDVEDVLLDPVIKFTEYLLGADDEEGAAGRRNFLQHVDPVTKAKLEALFETAGMGKKGDCPKQPADPEVLKRLTSSVSCALDEAAAALTRMRTTEPPSDGRSLIEACHEGDLAKVRQLLDDGRVSVHDTTEDGESLLSLACSAGYFELAQVLLAMRANVEDRGVKNECTPLMEAAGAGHADIVKLLIGYCADINAHSTCGNTPLMYACAGGHEQVVEILLAAGSQVEDHNENGHTPLMEAASSGHVGVAKILLKYGAGINTHSSEFKESALTLACYKGHLEMVRFLLACGADQEHKTDEMHTALMEASMDGHVEVARLLLDSGAQVNMPADSFESPLTLAACGGHVELAMLLLERGANIEEVNDEGYTPLMEAAREGHEEMVALLLSQGADINAQTDETQETALTLACCGGFIEVADFLIKAGADLEIGASTPLMEAAQEGHYELVRFLLDAGSDVKAQTSTGDTALSYACENGHTSVAELLMEHHADLEHESEGGRTPLMKAARAGHISTVQFLIGNGVDINKSTANKDHTALSLACAGGHLNVVELLLQYGADPYQKLKDNSTMLIEAAKGGHTSVVGVLLDYPRSIPIAPELVKSKKALPPRQKTVSQPKDQQGAKQAVPKPGVRKSQRPNPVSAKQLQPEVADASTSPPPLLAQGTIVHPLGDSTGFDFIEGSGFVIEGLEDKGLDAKSYIASVLKKSQRSTREEQILQKEQILAELQRVERELQEKANAQAQLSNTTTTITTTASNTNPAKRQQADHQYHQQHTDANANNDKSVQQPLPPPIPNSQVPFETFLIQKQGLMKEPPPLPPVTVTVAVPAMPTPTSTTTTSSGGSQCMSTPSVTNCPTNSASSIASRTANLANLPPSERPKAKPSRKICVDSNKALAAAGANHVQATASKKSQLQAALQQHNQQLLQLQQLQQLNQQLQQQVLQQRQLKQQNQATLTALQQNALSNQKQLATLQYNVAQLQALEQHILSQMPGGASGSTLTLQQNAQLQQRIQQILHQKQQLQQQIRTFQQQVEEQLAYTQHITAPCGTASPTPPPASPIDGGTVADSGGPHPKASRNKRSKDEFLCEAVPASHTFQALHFDTSVDKMPVLVDTNQLSAAVQACPVALDANVQTVVNGQVLTSQTIQVGRDLYMEQTTAIGFQNALRFGPYSFNAGGQIQYQGVSQSSPGGIPLIHDCSQGTPPQIYGHPPIQQHALYSFAQAPSDAVASVSFLPCDAAIPGTLVPIGNDQYAFQQQPQIGTVVSVIDQPLPVAQKRVDPASVPATVELIPSSSTCANVPSNNNLCAKQTAKKSKSVTFKKKEAEIIVDPNDKAAFATPVPHACTASHAAANPNGVAPGVALVNPPSSEQVLSAPPVDLDSATESNHDTALTLACAGGHEELVRLLLGRGADIEHRDKKGFTPLILAATAGHEKVVSILLDNHAEIEAQSERTKDTPLSLACSGGRFEVVDILLKRNANKEHRNVSDYTPLSLAASGGYVNIIKLLLNHGAEINSRTGSKLGISPLMLAAMNGHTTAVKLLLDSGSDINAQIETNRNTALTLACFQGRHEVVSLLLDRKANVEHRAKTGLTPLMEAASGGYVDVGRVLLDKGADVNAPPVPSSRDTALTIAADKGHYRFVELLLSRGAQVDVRNKKGNSSLWLAANGGHLEVVQLLYSAGADIDSQDNRKVSCLMAAFRKGNSKVVKWMVKHVTQFPSDQETARYIQTLTGSAENKDILKRCQQCMEVIRVAKDRQAAEAAKNASSLLEELDREKNLEESKKAAAARKREKKKRKKLERQMKCGSVTKDENEKAENQDEEEDCEKENRLEEPDEDEEEAVNNHDSGIDANSQGSSEHPEKISLPSGSSGSSTGSGNATSNTNKKNKKNRNKKNLSEISPVLSGVAKPEIDEDTMSETAKTHSEKSVSPTPTTSSSSPPRSKRVFQPLVKNKSPSENKISETTKDVKLEIFEKVVHSPKKVAPAPVIPTSRLSSATSSSSSSTGAPKSASILPAGSVEFGWKEVVRKSKKVSVPSHAISRVIGRGGCNINAIRELSGAHIEVEKQAQKPGAGQVERSISIKGSAEATRQAHTWIQAIISNPDKDVVDIIGKQNIKSLQQNHSGQSYLQQQQTLIINNSGLKAAGKPAAKPSATQPKGATVPVTNSKKSPTSSISQPGAKATTGLANPPAFPTPKLSSFAAVASGSSQASVADHFQSGPPKTLKPSDGLKDTTQSLNVKTSPHQPTSSHQQDQKMDYSRFTTQPSPVPGSGSEGGAGTGKIASEFSPFKTFKMSWVPELKEEPENKNFARVAATGLPPSAVPLPPNSTQEVSRRSPSPHVTDMSKAPGYRAGRIGSPHGSTWSNALEPLFPERCNSAPGTPLSPVVAIGPPSNNPQSSASVIGKPHVSPGSDPDHFRHGADSEGDCFRSGFSSSGIVRSITPDANGEHKDLFRRNPGGGKPGKSSVATPGVPSTLEPNMIAEDVIKAAAVQLAATAGFSDFSPTGARGDYQFEDFTQNSRYTAPLNASPVLLSPSGNINHGTIPPMSKPPPLAASGAPGMKLNPNARDFMRTSGSDFLRAPPRAPMGPTQSKPFSPFVTSRFNNHQSMSHMNLMGINTNSSTTFNILSNQSINALLSQQQPHQPQFDMQSFDTDLCGRTLREISDLFTDESVEKASFVSPQKSAFGSQRKPSFSQPQPSGFAPSQPSNFTPQQTSNFQTSQTANFNASSFGPPPPGSFLGSGLDALKFSSSRPIGSERQTSRPPPTLPTTASKSPWEQVLYEPYTNELTSSSFGFHGALAPGFEQFNKPALNGGSPEFVPGVTPTKSDFSPNFNLGSSGKKSNSGFMDMPANQRPDTTLVRRNMNNLWGKTWGNDDM